MSATSVPDIAYLCPAANRMRMKEKETMSGPDIAQSSRAIHASTPSTNADGLSVGFVSVQKRPAIRHAVCSTICDVSTGHPWQIASTAKSNRRNHLRGTVCTRTAHECLWFRSVPSSMLLNCLSPPCTTRRCPSPGSSLA
eukprot:662614-Rhodomonas_salina.8